MSTSKNNTKILVNLTLKMTVSVFKQSSVVLINHNYFYICSFAKKLSNTNSVLLYQNINGLCPSFTPNNITVPVKALVTSCLDYCNTLLYGLPHKSLHTIQLVQISTAGIIFRAPVKQHITNQPQTPSLAPGPLLN